MQLDMIYMQQMIKNITNLMEHVLLYLNLNNKVDMSEELTPQKNIQDKTSIAGQVELEAQIEEEGIKSFEEIAKNVIRDSIRSAICIDDTYASAYSREEGLNFD